MGIIEYCMVRKKILVVTDHMPWGHRSIARAIYGFLKTKEKEGNILVEYAEVKAETGIGGDAYILAYRYFPLSNRWARWISINKQARQLIAELSVVNMPGLRRLVDRVKPDLVFSCYWFHSHSLAKMREREKKNFRLWSVVADPWSMIPGTFVPQADLNLVYDEVGVKMAPKYGVEADKVMATGWWVREEMYGQIDRKKAREKLGIFDNRPVIFVGGGSLGTNSLTRLLPVMMMIKKKCAFIFNTGTDKLLHSMVEEYVKLLRKMKRGEDLIVRNLGWIDNMAEVLTASDIVFGKAGPNFLFDVVAREKPLVAITHIGGQEDGNIEIIKKKGLGWVKERPGQAADFLLEYLENPRYYERKFRKNIRAEAKNNQKTMGKIWERLKREILT
jgi:processive 1,2-diacylglycerol beta-glucosyltransferase